MKLPNITRKRAIFLVGLFAVLLLIFVSTRKEKGQVEEPRHDGAQFPTLPEQLTFDDVPTNPLIEINEVAMNNFFLDQEAEKSKYAAIVAKTDNYTIEYQNRFNKFLILVTGSPFFQHRVLAENALIDTLGIEREDACRLNVEVATPHFANPNQAGNTYGLSFCNE